MLTCLAVIENKYYIYNSDKKELKIQTANAIKVNFLDKGKNIKGLEDFPNVKLTGYGNKAWKKHTICVENAGCISYGEFPLPTFVITEPIKIPNLSTVKNVIYKGIHFAVESYGVEKQRCIVHRVGTASVIEKERTKYKIPKDFYIYDTNIYLQRIYEFFNCLVSFPKIDMFFLEINGFYSVQSCLDLTILPTEFHIQNKDIPITYDIGVNFKEVKTINRIKWKKLVYHKSQHTYFPYVSCLDCTQLSREDILGYRYNTLELYHLFDAMVKNKGVVLFKRQAPFIKFFIKCLDQVLNILYLGNFSRKNYNSIEELEQHIKRQQAKYALMLTDTDKDKKLIMVANIT